jgi:DNA-binding HxlR family transcriptional regulator
MQYDVFLADCPARTTLDVLGGNWSVVVITALGEERRRYTELLARIGGISRKVLTQVLRRLEQDGIVERTVTSSGPRAVHYALTPLGESALVPVHALVAWAEANTGAVLDARDRAQGVAGTSVLDLGGGTHAY